jgi:hypothetical protein
VVNTPRQIDRDIVRLRSQLQSLAKEPLRREAAQKLKQINIRDNRHTEEMFTTHDWLSEPMPKLKPIYAAISRKYAAKEKWIGDPTRLILVGEADRLKMAGLEQTSRNRSFSRMELRFASPLTTTRAGTGRSS